MNDDLKSSENRGQDEYPVTLIDTFNLLVRESGEYDTVRNYNPRFRGTRGGCGSRSWQYFLFTQGDRGGAGCGNDITYSRTNDNDNTEVVAGANRETFPEVK